MLFKTPNVSQYKQKQTQHNTFLMETQISLKSSTVKTGRDMHSSLKRKRTIKNTKLPSSNYFNMDLEVQHPRIYSQHQPKQKVELLKQDSLELKQAVDQLNPENTENKKPKNKKNVSKKTETYKMSSTSSSYQSSLVPRSTKSGKRNCFLQVYSRLPLFHNSISPNHS